MTLHDKSFYSHVIKDVTPMIVRRRWLGTFFRTMVVLA
jgi:hypothetical protein